MKVLVIVNQSPWGATLPVVALRLVRAMTSDDVEIDAVYFRGDGVYNALPGRARSPVRVVGKPPSVSNVSLSVWPRPMWTPPTT